MFTELTKNGIEYTYDLSVNGARYVLWPADKTTKEDIKEAKHWLRDNHDVVSIRIADEYDLDQRYNTDIFEDQRVRPLKWYQVNNDLDLIRKERKSGLSVADYITKNVLPFIAETEKRLVAKHGAESVYSR